MNRMGFLSMVASLVLSAPLPAQTGGWQFRWQQGQVLTYRVEHISSASEVADGGKSDTTSKLNLTKRWQVQAVDAAGGATLGLSLASLRLETTTPGGGSLLFDSSKPDQSTPQMRQDLARFVGPPLAGLPVDPQGQLGEVKE